MEVVITEGCLPAKHFAILFEGAWLFTPAPKDTTRILATCPFIGDTTHKCRFGTWEKTYKQIDSLDGMTTEMPEENHYWVEVDGFNESTYPNFAKLFEAAAHSYPFVYLPQQHNASFTMTNESKYSSMRSISVPIPTSLRAGGAMISAEIGGLGIGDVFEPTTNVKRPFVAFLFIYEYDGDIASAKVHAQEKVATIEANPHNRTPHLIFNVHPSHGYGDGFFR